MKSKVILFLLISFYSLFSNAAIVDGGSFIQDTKTQLDWLKMSFTKGKSYDDILSLINSDISLVGYEFATRVQVKELLNNHYGDNTIGPGPVHDDLNFTQTYNIIQLFGLTREIQDSRTGGPSFSVDQYITIGYVADTFGSRNTHYATEIHARDYLNEFSYIWDKGFIQFNGNTFGRNNIADEYIGGFLVRSSISAVPEPSTYIMMMLGLLCLLVHLRNKTYQSYDLITDALAITRIN